MGLKKKKKTPCAVLCRPVISPDMVDHATGIDIVQVELEGGLPLPGQWGVTRIPWDASGQIAKDKHGWNIQARSRTWLADDGVTCN